MKKPSPFKLKVIMASSADALERKVNAFLAKHDHFESNYQRNIFYPRMDSQGKPLDEGWALTTQETYTAFIIHY